MKSQNERLLEYLQNNQSIGPMEALNDLGIYRLASRICDLKGMGHQIEKITVKVKNRFDETCRVARYELRNDTKSA